MFERKQQRFYAESFESKTKDKLGVSIHDNGNDGYEIGWIKTKMKDPKTLWVEIQINVQKSNRVFTKTFKRSVGQELMIMAAKWGKKKGATHVDLENVSDQGKRMLKRAIEFGLITKEGKILKIPKQLNLKENRRLEKPISPRRPIVTKPGRKIFSARRR